MKCLRHGLVKIPQYDIIIALLSVLTSVQLPSLQLVLEGGVNHSTLLHPSFLWLVPRISLHLSATTMLLTLLFYKRISTVPSYLFIQSELKKMLQFLLICCFCPRLLMLRLTVKGNNDVSFPNWEKKND